MDVAEVEAGLTQGYEALATGDWEAARATFAAVVDGAETAEALDGLGRALWWLRDAEGAIVSRERAYAGFRRDGELGRAARIALWLGREYALAWGNEAAANGWLARAERLLADVAPGSERGWLELAQSERSRDHADAARLASGALETALSAGDTDLELRALAQLGLAEVSLGRVDDGLARLDEAMAAVTSGEPTTLETFADVCCTLLMACELAGEGERARQWSQVLESFARKYDPVVLLAFCRSCCADLYAATGRVDAAEEELVAALRELTRTGQRSRCVHPAARLAEIRIHQGRLDEADQLLSGIEEESEAVGAAVALRLARGEATAAAALLEHRLSGLGSSNLLAAPLLGQLVEAKLATGDVAGAREAVRRLDTIAEVARRGRTEAIAFLAHGRVAAAAGDPQATAVLEQAVTLFTRQRLPLESAQARLELARSRLESAPELAADEARRALGELEELGATHEADAAAALLRSLGAKGRTSPRRVGELSRRELDVLRLLREGLSNREVARRLFISPKTAEHHVGRILAKLDLHSRAEAAAYASRTLDDDLGDE